MIDKFKLGSGLIRYIRGATASPKPPFKYIRPALASAAQTQELKAVTKDYHSILGVPRSASFRDIKNAYYTLAKEFHPDLNRPGMENTAADETKFKEITEAYEALMNDYKKGDSVIALNPELYRNVTEERRQSISTAWKTVNELNYEDVVLSISYKEATEGSRREVKIPIGTKCDKCSSYGTFPPRNSEGSCNVCQGTGKQTIYTENGTLYMTCKFCKGTRTVITPKIVCPKCHGKGFLLKPHVLMINIPKGSSNRDVIKTRIPGHQRAINIILNVQDAERFQRNGLNIYTTEEISLAQAILGANIPIKGINGMFNVHITPGTQPNAEFRIPGKGICDMSTQEHGQHIVKVKIRIPTVVTTRQRHLLRELDASLRETDADKPDLPFSR
ncbi:dnaJ homolog subfamily A member 3, mitochondrial-like [Wyeomyia smithii]|uniref:dnaJ homolog subfamily A member 3, mitochondrial-like n=1 Tax=Wyeomyia smithii TaxID=174621 RepID=UPI0024682107|nr:dnaJ homolog subfamily A member 3, mitochondrial-like [Wyeomyia smithii]